MKKIIEAYRQTLDSLMKRREELCVYRGDCDRRIMVLDFEIEEVQDVLHMLAKYDDENDADQ